MNRQRYVILGCEHTMTAAIVDVDVTPVGIVCHIKAHCCESEWTKVLHRAEEMRDMLNREQQVREALSETKSNGGKS